MSELPLVTIVSASYNHIDHLYKTIKSVCMQSYGKIEYIICDDASDCFPKEEIEKYLIKNKSNNIVSYRIISNSKNVGTVRNLNNAYKKANGLIVLPLSCGDCFYSPDTVSTIVNRFMETGCKVLATSMIKYEGEFIPIEIVPHVDARRIIQSRDSARKQYDSFITAHFHEMIAGCNLYITKAALEEYDYFDEKYDLWEDGPFLSKYLFSDKVEFAYDIISIWYEGGGVSDKPFDYHSPRMKKDVRLYATSDAIKHIDTFSFIDRRRIRYRYKRITSGHTLRRYILYIIYLPEVIHYVLYTRKWKKLKNGDARFIEQLKLYQ